MGHDRSTERALARHSYRPHVEVKYFFFRDGIQLYAQAYPPAVPHLYQKGLMEKYLAIFLFFSLPPSGAVQQWRGLVVVPEAHCNRYARTSRHHLRGNEHATVRFRGPCPCDREPHPAGKVMTYKRVAELAGNPGGAVSVAPIFNRELRKNKDTTLPWHRVVGSNRTILIQGHLGELQRKRLEQEGIEFESDKIDLRNHLWEVCR